MISKLVQDEAIDWFVRLRSGAVTDGDRAELLAWLARSPAHQEAYQRVERRWSELDIAAGFAEDRLQGLNLSSSKKASGRFRRSAASVALAAMLVLALACGLYVLPGAVINDVSPPQQSYRTDVGEQRRLLLDDGSTLHLNTDTAVKVSLSASRRDIVLEWGEILVDVAHDAHRPLAVTVDDTQFVALGTQFSVRRDADSTTLYVEEGRVAVLPQPERAERPATVKAIVGAGEQALLHADSRGAASVNVGRADGAELTSWRDGRLIFQQTPLSVAVAEMNRYFPGEIVIGPDVPALAVTGSFKLRDRNVMLLALEASLPVRYVDTGEGRTVLVYDAKPAPRPRSDVLITRDSRR